MTALIRRFRADDTGAGMLLVVGTIGVLTSLMLVVVTTATRSLGSSRKHVSYESAMSAAETGIDVALSRAQNAYTNNGTDSYLSPATGDASCNAASVAWPFTTTPTAQQERVWARTQLNAIATNAACRKSVKGGEYVLLKPSGHQAVYAKSWSPAYGANEVKSRMVKAEYLFVPYAPSNAILTTGDLEIDSSTRVTTAGSNDPSLAQVHSNGSITVPNGNPTVTGRVSQSGSGTAAQSNRFTGNVGGTVLKTPLEPVPPISAESVWGRNHASGPPGGWYDLCEDGKVRSPDGSAPCTGTVLGTNSFRGWTYDGSGTVKVWQATSAIMVNGYSGTYYIDGGNAVNNASNAGSVVPNLTVIAASHSTGCSKVGGNIDWDHTDIAAPSMPNLFMLADQDLLTRSNFYAGSSSGGTVVSGLFIAGDQVQMETSSDGAFGAVIAADMCDPANGSSLVDSNVIKNPSIYYDPNGRAPFVDIINTTLWLEMPL